MGCNQAPHALCLILATAPRLAAIYCFLLVLSDDFSCTLLLNPCRKINSYRDGGLFGQRKSVVNYVLAGSHMRCNTGPSARC